MKFNINYYLIIIVILAILIITFIPQDIMYPKEIRHATKAGTWYSSNPNILSEQINNLYNSIEKNNYNVKAVISPHAGLQYSGKIAATSFANINNNYDNIFILAPAHTYYLKGLSIMNVTHYETPLGLIPLSNKAKEIRKKIGSINEAHTNEHSIEILLPFLQEKLHEFEITPILVGKSNINEINDILNKFVEEDDLIVVSVDLSHYHDAKTANELDTSSVNTILNLDEKQIFNEEIDAPWAVSSLLKLAKEKNWKPIFLDYTHSGTITGDNSKVVGYASIIFVEENTLSNEEKNILLKLARDKLNSIYTKEKIDISNIPDSLKEKQGCFTTLNKNHELRGCIGDILPKRPLYECILGNTEKAALKDPRFNQVTKEELEDIEIEISVLSVPKETDFENIVPFQDGVVLKKGIKQATYLPQVWQNLPDKELFFSSLCKKANLDNNCYKDEDTKFFTYQADVFEE